MAQHNWSSEVKRGIASRCGAHLEVMDEILVQLKALGWSDQELFGVQMALEESLTNAIRHGNGKDESKQVSLEWKLSSERFWLRVQDEGAGFLPAQVPDCTDQENLTACGGRGLLLICAYMTHVEYNDAGNCITMEKIRGEEENALIDVSS